MKPDMKMIEDMLIACQLAIDSFSDPHFEDIYRVLTALKDGEIGGYASKDKIKDILLSWMGGATYTGDLSIDELASALTSKIAKPVVTGKIVIWKDGTWKYIENGITWEYENDADWLLTISLADCREAIRKERGDGLYQ